MHAWLYLSRPDQPDACLWWRDGDTPTRGDLAGAAAALGRLPLTLLLPMEVASRHDVEVPARSGRWLRPAILALLEERLLDDPGRLHLALGPLRNKGSCSVLALDRAWLRERLERLAGQGLDPARIHLDADCLSAPGPAALFCEGRWLLGGAGPHLALGEEALEQLRPLLPEATRPDGEVPWPVLERGAAEAIDLRQGEFARQAGGPRAWRFLALMALAALLAQGGADLGKRWVLEHHLQQVRQENLATWRQKVPDEPALDLARQVRARLQQERRPREDLARRLEHLARQWRDGGGALARLQRLDYQAGEGWTLQVSAPAFADLERLRESLAKQGLEVRSDSAQRDNRGVSARFQIKD